jgi:hypothetical protein
MDPPVHWETDRQRNVLPVQLVQLAASIVPYPRAVSN